MSNNIVIALRKAAKETGSWELENLLYCAALEIEVKEKRIAELLLTIAQMESNKPVDQPVKVCPVCRGEKNIQTKTRGLINCKSCNGTGNQ